MDPSSHRPPAVPGRAASGLQREQSIAENALAQNPEEQAAENPRREVASIEDGTVVDAEVPLSTGFGRVEQGIVRRILNDVWWQGIGSKEHAGENTDR